MNKTVLVRAVPVLLAACATLAAPSHAEEAQPDSSVTFNAALASDYRYRAVSQTRLRPALQGGADYAHEPSGLYAGTWLSTIKWTRDAGGGGAIEWDLYAGKRGRLFTDHGAGLAYDLGVLAYLYPGNGLKDVPGFVNAHTGEAYGQLGYGPAYVKYSLALTNLFGFADSRRSGYLDIGANLGLGGGLVLNLHAGRQDVRHNGQASYTDYKLGVTKDVGVATLALAWIATNAGDAAYASPANGKFLARNAFVASIGKTF